MLGFANLIADGISMGYGDFLSSTAEKDYSASQQTLADWSVANDIHGEMLELVSVYEEQGMAKDDADKVSAHSPKILVLIKRSYSSPSIMLTIESRMVSTFSAHSPISFEHICQFDVYS